MSAGLNTDAAATSITRAAGPVITLRGETGQVDRVRIARRFGSRFVGLLNRSQLGATEGLLFDPGGSIHTLWMRFAIDVVFIDEDMKIIRIAANVRPWSFAFAPRGTRFVLELAAGAASTAGFDRGVVLRSCRQEGTYPS